MHRNNIGELPGLRLVSMPEAQREKLGQDRSKYRSAFFQDMGGGEMRSGPVAFDSSRRRRRR